MKNSWMYNPKKIIPYAFLMGALFLSEGVFPSVNPVRAGDVVGRNLDLPGLKGFGHVGMFDGKGHVIEVLNVKGKVVQKNSLKSFKSKSKYWGARYSNATRVKLYRDRMVKNGYNQRKFSPSYTFTSIAVVGGYKKICLSSENPFSTALLYGREAQCYQWGYVLKKGRWRCDTFVNYMYRSVMHEPIASVMTPRNIYRAMPRKR